MRARIPFRLSPTRHAVNELVERLFGGSEESLVMSMLDVRRLTPQKLDRLIKLIKTAREADHDRS